jgi:hypothetical protein
MSTIAVARHLFPFGSPGTRLWTSLSCRALSSILSHKTFENRRRFLPESDISARPLAMHRSNWCAPKPGLFSACAMMLVVAAAIPCLRAGDGDKTAPPPKAAGKYVLTAGFRNNPPDRLSTHPFSVPEINKKLSQRPVDVGVLTLDPIIGKGR